MSPDLSVTSGRFTRIQARYRGRLGVEVGASVRIDTLISILTAHGVEHDVIFADDPGQQIYEDDFQIGIIPRQRDEPTAMPEGLILGATSAGTKRQFANGA